jgi:hypothetical protein
MNTTTASKSIWGSALLGWKVRYYEPTYGMREYIDRTRADLDASIENFNTNGLMYTVTEIPAYKAAQK